MRTLGITGRSGCGKSTVTALFRSHGVVYARCPRKDGLSMAVYNRLIRAAAFRVIAL